MYGYITHLSPPFADYEKVREREREREKKREALIDDFVFTSVVVIQRCKVQCILTASTEVNSAENSRGRGETGDVKKGAHVNPSRSSPGLPPHPTALYRRKLQYQLPPANYPITKYQLSNYSLTY